MLLCYFSMSAHVLYTGPITSVRCCTSSSLTCKSGITMARLRVSCKRLGQAFELLETSSLQPHISTASGAARLLGAARRLFGFAKGSKEPLIPCKPATHTAYGHEWRDEYSWLERPSKQVQGLLEREQQHFEAWMQGPAQRAQQALVSDMLRLLPDEQVTPPERVGPYLYFVRQLQDSPHPCYVRRRVAAGAGAAGGGEGEEEVLLDVNELARVHGDSVSVGQVKLSRCSRRLAFTLDPGDGSELQAGFTRDLSSGRLRQHPAMEGGVVSLEWAGDGHTLLWTEPNMLGRPCRVRRSDVDAAAGPGELVFEEGDERYFVELSRTKDWAYLAVNCNSKTSSEVRLIPADQPGAPAWLVAPRREGLEYFCEHHSGRLLLLSNAQGAENYALFSAPAPPTAPSDPDSWHMLVPEREGVSVEDMDVFKDAVVLYERHSGQPQVAILPMGGSNGGVLEGAAADMYQVPLPAWARSVSPGANADYPSPSLRLTLSSPTHPDTLYDLHLPSRQLQLVQAPSVQCHDPEQYHCAVQWATSADGTAVPITVAHAAGMKFDGRNPCLVLVYGAYGHCLPTDFYAERIPLLQRGWVVAFAHVRGGGELGRLWHAAGRADKKPNSIADLEACIQALTDCGLTRPDLVALEALSAGGLTAAALLNRSPSAAAAAILEAPFVDVLTAMCDPTLPLTMHEYGEWGDPSDHRVFEQLRSLCPYQNIRPGPYPAMLVTCSQSDFRVPYWGPLKYAAKLRAAQQGQGEVLLLPDAHEGHFAQEAERFQVKATHYAWLLKALRLMD